MNRDGTGKAAPVPITVGAPIAQEAVPWSGGGAEPNNNGWISGAVIFGVMVIILLFFGAPIWTLFSLNHGLKNGDPGVVQKIIDTEAVRNQILNEAVGMGGGEEEAGTEAIGDFVNENITPEGLVEILKTNPEERPIIPVVERTFGNYPSSKVRGFSYKNLDTVVVEMDDGMILFLERAGVFDWRIFRVDFPSS